MYANMASKTTQRHREETSVYQGLVPWVHKDFFRCPENLLRCTRASRSIEVECIDIEIEVYRKLVYDYQGLIL